MNETIKELGKKAGFQFDSMDCNFYGEEGWCNQKISKLVKLTVLEVCKDINKWIQHNNPNDCLLVIDLKDKFGIEQN